MRRKWLRLIALLATVVLVAAACGDDDDEATTAGTEPTETTEADEAAADRGNVDGVLKIGSLLPETGDLAALGPPMVGGVEMAIRDINAAGGVTASQGGGAEAEVQHVQIDDGTDADVASEAVDKLLTGEKVDVIVGAAASSVTAAVVDKISGAQVPECSPSNTGAGLTPESSEDPTKDYYFRTPPPDNLQGPALANVIAEDGHETVGIIALDDEYGQGFVKFLKPALEEAGVEVVVDRPYDPKGSNFDTDVKELVDADPDAIAVIAFPDTGSKVLAAMIEAGVGPKDKQLYVTDGLQSSTLSASVDPDNVAVLEGVKGTAPSAAPKEGAPFFADAFADFAPDVDTIFSAHAYDCTILFALAAHAAGSDAGPDIQKEMVGLTKGGEVCNTFADCKALLDEGKDIDYDGAAGKLDFTDAGEPSAGEYDVYVFNAEGGTDTVDSVAIGGAA